MFRAAGGGKACAPVPADEAGVSMHSNQHVPSTPVLRGDAVFFILVAYDAVLPDGKEDHASAGGHGDGSRISACYGQFSVVPGEGDGLPVTPLFREGE